MTSSTHDPIKVALTREQVRRLDELAATRYHLSTLVLMENAGRSAAFAVDDAYGPAASAIIVCGAGNNGGDGFVTARHLHNLGWVVRLLVACEISRMTSETLANYRVIKAMQLDAPVAPDTDAQRTVIQTIRPDEVVIDALLGIGFSGQVRSPTAELIAALNDAPRRAMVAIDIPSGLNCDTGTPSKATIRADLTVTFVAPKAGFTAPDARPYLGRVAVGDIGVPRKLIADVTTGDS